MHQTPTHCCTIASFFFFYILVLHLLDGRIPKSGQASYRCSPSGSLYVIWRKTRWAGAFDKWTLCCLLCCRSNQSRRACRGPAGSKASRLTGVPENSCRRRHISGCGECSGTWCRPFWPCLRNIRDPQCAWRGGKTCLTACVHRQNVPHFPRRWMELIQKRLVRCKRRSVPF